MVSGITEVTMSRRAARRDQRDSPYTQLGRTCLLSWLASCTANGNGATELAQRELDFHDRPCAGDLHIFDFQQASLRPADEAAALLVRHLRQRAVLRNRSLNVSHAVEPSGSPLTVRGDFDRVRCTGMIRSNAAHRFIGHNRMDEQLRGGLSLSGANLPQD